MVYIDDIIIFSETPGQHIEHIQAVLKLLLESNFQLNLKKSKFFCKEVEFLGMKVSEGTLKVDGAKI